MRWRIAAAALLMLAALAPVGAPAAPRQFTVDASESGAVGIDLVDNAADSLLFRLHEANFSAAHGPIRSASVRLASANGAMELALSLSGGDWSVALPVSTTDLVVGTWQARFVALRDNGATTLGNRSLDVTARDTQPPQLSLAQSGDPVVVGPAGSIDLVVKDALLQRVWLEYSGVPVTLDAPYSLRGDLFPEGRTAVTFHASDRALHSSVLSVDVVRDTTAPMVNLTVPEHVYAGVPFLARVRVAEAGPYTLRFSVNGTALPDTQVTGAAEPGADRLTAFTVTPNATGALALGVEAIDQVGAHAFADRTLDVAKPVTDLRLSHLGTSPPGPQFAQRPVRFTVTLEQVEGVTSLSVPVNFTVNGQSFSKVQDLPAGGPRHLTWEVQLPGGHYTATASAQVPEGANETAPGDETDSVDVEVFLGRIVDNGTAYDIRAGDNGLPSAAVVEGKSRTYALKLVDSGRGVAYRFTADGNRTVDWNPLAPLGEAPPASATSSSGSSTGKAKPSPAAGPLVLAVVVALAALAQRKRL